MTLDLTYPKWFAPIEEQIRHERDTFRYDQCVAVRSPFGEYERGLASIFGHGDPVPDRTGTGTLSQFCHQMRFNMHPHTVLDSSSPYFGQSLPVYPLVTTKKVHFKSVFHELIWMLKGLTNIKYLTDNKITIWDEWADENGDLGPVYGKQWRDFAGVDQITEVLAEMKRNPYSRRLVISAWNPQDLPEMKLQPCHILFQFIVRNGRMNCHFFMRSNDAFLGTPFNIAQYAMLNALVAKTVGVQPGELVLSVTDFHLYSNHLSLAKMQLTREPYPYPFINIKTARDNLWDYKFDDVEIIGYKSHPAIKADVAV